MANHTQTIKLSIEVDAPNSTVWNILTSPDSFKIWGENFMPGSFFEGHYALGETIKFMCYSKGELIGMAVKISEYELNRSLKTECLGLIENGQIVTEGEESQLWKGLIESYKVSRNNDKSCLSIEIESPLEAYDEFLLGWTKSLKTIKDLAESKA